MNNSKEQQPSYYVVIPASIRYDKDLPMGARMLYGEITAMSNTSGFCWATNKYFAELYDVDPRTISRWIGQLSDKKHIVVEMSYKEDSKEIDKRKIYLASAFYTYDQKDQEAPKTKSSKRILQDSKNNKEEKIYKKDSDHSDPTSSSDELFEKPTGKQTPKEFYDYQLKISKGLKHHDSYQRFVDFLYGDNDIKETLTPILKIPKQLTYVGFTKILEVSHRNNKRLSEILLKIYNNKKYTEGKRDLYLLLNNWSTNRFISDDGKK